MDGFERSLGVKWSGFGDILNVGSQRERMLRIVLKVLVCIIGYWLLVGYCQLLSWGAVGENPI